MVWDEGLFRLVNEGPEWLAPTMKGFSQAHTYRFVVVALVALVAALVIKGGAHRRAAVQALIAFPIADGICSFLKKTFEDARPCALYDDVVLWISCGSPMGTASSHAGNTAAVAMVFWVNLGWRWGIGWLLVSLITGVSRVFVAAHFPHQVALGWLVGALAGAAIAYGWRWKSHKQAA